jgi:hypothetical protein
MPINCTNSLGRNWGKFIAAIAKPTTYISSRIADARREGFSPRWLWTLIEQIAFPNVWPKLLCRAIRYIIMPKGMERPMTVDAADVFDTSVATGQRIAKSRTSAQILLKVSFSSPSVTVWRLEKSRELASPIAKAERESCRLS